MIVDAEARETIIQVIGYSPSEVVEREVIDVDCIAEFIGKWPVTWVNVYGVANVEKIRRLGELFKIHPLALEDAVHQHQRAKVEEYEEHLFIVARMADLKGGPETEQLSIFLGENFVLTIQEKPGDNYDPVRRRLRKGGGRIRNQKADYLTYTLLDATIDGFFPVMENYGARLEKLQQELLESPTDATVYDLHNITHQLLWFKRTIQSHREMINLVRREEDSVFSEETRIYLRDVADHLTQLMDLVESHRELGASLMHLYLTISNNNMNEVMKVLTIVTSFFIPLSFIASVYGMNFNPTRSGWNMPELNWIYGYPFALGLMALVALFLVGYFYRKGWIWASGSPRPAFRSPERYRPDGSMDHTRPPEAAE